MKKISKFLTVLLLGLFSLTGVQTARAYNIGGSNVKFYFLDNDSWNACQMYYWGSNWNNTANFTKISNTKIYYYSFSSTWTNLTGYKLRNNDQWSKQSSGNFESNQTSSMWVIGSSTTKNTDLTKINAQAKVVVCRSEDGSTYETSESAKSSDCVATISGYNVASGATSTTAVSGSTSGTANSYTIQAAYGSTVTITASDGSQYEFMGFSKTKGTSLPSGVSKSTVTYTATGQGSTTNATYYAYFKKKTYSITYHCNDATSGCPDDATEQTALPNPLPTPEKTGYTFGGWYTNEGLTSAAVAGSTLSANADLYAKWNIKSYAVNFSGEHFTPSFTSGTEKEYNSTVEFTLTAAQDYAIDKVTSEQVTINKDGETYSFTMPASAVTVNVTTYSTAVTTYTIRFLNSDETVLQTSKVEENTMPVYNGSTPTKDATAEFTFTFAGWDKEIVEATEDADYTATYNSTRVQYTLTWAGIEGATVEGGTAAGLVANASPITAPTVTKTGYTFDGWNPEVPATMPAVNSTYTAQWTERTITLQKSDYNGLKQAIMLTASNPTGFTPTAYTFYYSKDGGDYTAIDEASAEATTTYTPTVAGSYTFKVVASDGTYNVEATTTAVTCNIPAYLVYATGSADWNAKATASEAVNDIISVTIDGAILRLNSSKSYFAFRLDDATGWNVNKCFGSNTKQDVEVATTGTTTTSKLNPSNGLYIKPGDDKADYTFTFSFNITNAQVSVTKTHKPVTVTYDANNATEGTVPVDETQYEVGATVTVKTNSGNLTRTGYTYDGWNTKNDGKGTSYSAVEPLGTFEITANTTLYAKWNPITYNITYNVPEGASKGENPETYTIESSKITLKDASMEGKVFDGWFTSDEYSEQVTEIAKGSTGDKTLYAKFHDTKTYRLYYSNPEGWSTVKAYLWEESSKPNTNKNADWPGEDITSNTVVINNRTFYYYEFDETKGWDRIIFNNCASSTATSPKTGDITFSVPANDNQYNNAKASATGTWQPLPEPIDPETPYTTVKVLCDYNGTTPVKIFFKDISSDFMVIDAEQDGTTGEYTMNALGQQTIDESTGYLYEVSFYGTCKMAIFVSKSHIGTGNKLTSQDVDLTKAARVTYYYDLTGVTAGQPKTNDFTKIWVPLTQGYGTFCYPQAVQVSQAVPFWMEIEENTEETSGYELLMTAMDDNILPANTGALIYSKQQNAQAILTVVESSTTYPDNDFIGTTARTAISALNPALATGEKVYVLGNSSGIAFYDYQPTSGYIPAYKAYFRLTPKAAPQGAPSRVKMTFRTEPATPTGMDNVNATRMPNVHKFVNNGQLIIIRDGKQFNAMGQKL